MKACDLTCPGCGKKSDTAINPDELEQLAPGDLTICPGCGRILVLDLAGKVREADGSDLEDLSADDRKFLEAVSAETRRRKN